MTGIPVAPCPCKTTAGIDVSIMMMNRDQAGTSQSAMCAGCSTTAAVSCARKRYYCEWYAVATGIGTSDTTGFLRGFTDPTKFATQRTDVSYTFPWDVILLRARYELTNPAEIYDYADAIDPATTNWQLSVWTDPTYADEDDFANGTTYFNISDVVPNGDGVLVNGVDPGTALTFCEGNFNTAAGSPPDRDVDGGDAAIFKQDFGRSGVLNPCPSSNYYY